jgi:hypothetical protein
MTLMRHVSFRTSVRLAVAFLTLSLAVPALAQKQLAKAAAPDRPGLLLRASDSPARAQVLLDPLAAEWGKISAQRIALNRTPLLYDTEAPAELEIPYVDVRLARIEGKLLVQMTWRDSTQNTAQIAKLPAAPYEGRSHKEPTEATDRFFDSAAVMLPLRPPVEGVWPSLQMGDAGNPVSIYFWNSARGSARMQAEGRGTTKRTGEAFPAQGIYRDGSWHVAMELENIAPGLPLAFAVWNGSQQDRDGRKYFTPWLRLE